MFSANVQMRRFTFLLSSGSPFMWSTVRESPKSRPMIKRCRYVCFRLNFACRYLPDRYHFLLETLSRSSSSILKWIPEFVVKTINTRGGTRPHKSYNAVLIGLLIRGKRPSWLSVTVRPKWFPGLQTRKPKHHTPLLLPQELDQGLFWETRPCTAYLALQG